MWLSHMLAPILRRAVLSPFLVREGKNERYAPRWGGLKTVGRFLCADLLANRSRFELGCALSGKSQQALTLLRQVKTGESVGHGRKHAGMRPAAEAAAHAFDLGRRRVARDPAAAAMALSTARGIPDRSWPGLGASGGRTGAEAPFRVAELNALAIKRHRLSLRPVELRLLGRPRHGCRIDAQRKACRLAACFLLQSAELLIHGSVCPLSVVTLWNMGVVRRAGKRAHRRPAAQSAKVSASRM